MFQKIIATLAATVFTFTAGLSTASAERGQIVVYTSKTINAVSEKDAEFWIKKFNFSKTKDFVKKLNQEQNTWRVKGYNCTIDKILHTEPSGISAIMYCDIQENFQEQYQLVK